MKEELVKGLNLSKFKIFVFIIILFTSSSIVYSARLPIVNSDNNQWGTILNEYLNITLDENGSIKSEINATNSLWNISSTNIFQRDITSRVGIGTISPSEILTVIGNVNISGYLNISGNLIINNQFNVTASSGNVNIAGILDAGDVRVTGSIVQVESAAFKLVNFTNEYSSTGWRLANFTSAYDARADRFVIANYSSEYASTGYKLSNFTSNYASEYASTGYKKGNLSSDLSGGAASTIVTTSFTSDNVVVNKNIYIIGNISNTNLVSLNVNGSLFPAIDANFDLGNNTLRWRNANLSGTITAGTVDGTNVRVVGKDVQIEADAFKINNFTSAYDARSDRYGNANFTSDYGTEYASTGYKIANFTSDFNSRINNSDMNITNLTVTTISRTTNNTNLQKEILIIGNVNLSGSINITGGLTVKTLNAGSCDLKADGSGNFYCGVDAGGSGETFNLANYSTEYSSTGYKRANVSEYLGGADVNASILKASNISNILNDAYKVGNFTSNLNSINASISLWNITFGNALFTRELSWFVRIGNINTSDAVNIINDTFIVSGSGAFYGALNATYINATEIRVGNKNLVQEEGIGYKIANFTSNYDARADRFARANISEYLGGADVNASLIKASNLSGYQIESTAFKIANYSTLNATDAQWNVSGSNIYPRGITGNVGIGTTAPQNRLEVIGATTFAGGVNASSLNVTGFSIADDSLVTLSDGSKKKIKDIKEGDYVLSLNEATGKLESAKVNALLDHGIKPIYEMTTEDGKAINTTAEHPYFVRTDQSIILMPSSARTHVLPLNLSENLSDHCRNKDSYLEISGGCTRITTIAGNSAGGNKEVFKKSLSNDNIALPSSHAIRYNLEFLTPFSAYLISMPLSESDLSNLASTSSSAKNLNFKVDKPLTSEFFSSVVQGSPDMLLSQRRISFENIFKGLSSLKHLEDLRDPDSGAFESGLSAANFAVSNNEFINFGSHNIDNYNLLFKSYDNSNKLGTWIEVKDLSVGDEIAVLDYSTGAIKWEKISSIKTLEPQHVYDLSIEGTRNFIANDIVAHNTYLATASGNVGIGTTTPDNLLTILGNELTANAILHLNTSDNYNTSVVNAITLDHILKNPVNSTGGVGVSILFRATDNASELENIGNISAILYNSTNGSELSAITFSTRGADTGDSADGHLLERMRIDGSGRVGIAQTSPNVTLGVSGTANITGRVTTGPLNVTGGLGVSELNAGSCDLKADGSGNFYCGVDAGGSGETFNLANYSTEYSSTGFKRANVSEYLGGADVNASFIKSTNASFLNLFSRVADAWNSINLTGFLGGTDSNASILRIGNISNILNDAYKVGNFTSNLNSVNSSLALWNVTFNNALYTRELSWLVRIGNINTSVAVNLINDTFIASGSAAIYGSLNATYINATEIRVGNRNIVQEEGTSFKISNYSSEYSSTGFKIGNFSDQYELKSYYKLANFTSNYDARADRYGNANFTSNYDARADRFTRANISDYLGGADVNASLIKVGNLTGYQLETPAYKTANYSAEYSSTGYKFANFSSNLNSANFSLWNITYNFTYPKESFYRVAIGDFNKTAYNLSEALRVVGNVSITGNLSVGGNIFVGDALLQVESAAFKIINYSNEYANTGYKLTNFTSNYATEYSSTGWKIANETELLGGTGSNASILRVGNISNIRESLYNLANFTSNLNSVNTSISLWNVTFGNALFTRELSLLVRIGNINTSTAINLINDTFIASGSAAIYGSLNATFINATEIRVGNKNIVQEEGTSFKISNYSSEYGSTGFKIGNFTDQYELKSYYKLANFTSNYDARTDRYSVTNYSTDYANSGYKLANFTSNLNSANASISLWNASGSNVYLRDITGLVAIGTITPDNLLTILGNEITANAILHLNTSDNYNTSVVNAITLDHILKNPVNSTGGVGVSILFRATDNASELENIANISAILYNSTNGSELSAITFSTRGADTGDSADGHLLERARIDGSGRVGINNTKPNETLQVRGTFSVESGSGVQGLLINPSGNVGIGTSSPGEELEIKTANPEIRMNDSDSTIGNFWDIGPTGDDFKILVNDTKGITIDQDGFVGIGTTNPAQNFVVTAPGSTNAGFEVAVASSITFQSFNRNSGTYATTNFDASIMRFRPEGKDKFRVTTDGVGVGAAFSASSNGIVYMLEVANGSAGKDVNLTNTLYVNGSVPGVGINTKNPLDALEVIGNVRVSGSLNATSINTTGYAAFAVNSGNVGIGTATPNYLLQVASGTDGRSVNLSNVLYVNGSSGNVGIGTTTPSEALDVKGNVQVTQTINTTTLNTTNVNTDTLLFKDVYVYDEFYNAPAKYNVLASTNVTGSSNDTDIFGVLLINTSNVAGGDAAVTFGTSYHPGYTTVGLYNISKLIKFEMGVRLMPGLGHRVAIGLFNTSVNAAQQPIDSGFFFNASGSNGGLTWWANACNATRCILQNTSKFTSTTWNIFTIENLKYPDTNYTQLFYINRTLVANITSNISNAKVPFIGAWIETTDTTRDNIALDYIIYHSEKFNGNSYREMKGFG